MKIKIEIDENLSETEVTLRCASLNEENLALSKAISEAAGSERRIRLYAGDHEYYLAPEDILFFESSGGKTYAHTEDAVFETKLRLYELEEMLPRSFIRVSKSAILGTKHIYSIEKNPVGPGTISFRGTHKKISVSRQYYHVLKDRMG